MLAFRWTGGYLAALGHGVLVDALLLTAHWFRVLVNTACCSSALLSVLFTTALLSACSVLLLFCSSALLCFLFWPLLALILDYSPKYLDSAVDLVVNHVLLVLKILRLVLMFGSRLGPNTC